MKILSLDDHPLFSMGLKASLATQSINFEITTVNNSREALEFLLVNHDVDLLVLDLSMPEINGISFMRAMNARDIDTPVVIMSANEDLSMISEALSLGALGFISKSSSAEDLMNAFYSIESGDVFLPENIKTGLSTISKRSAKNTQTVLSKRQLEILKMVQAGLSNNAISEVLYISLATVKSHMQTIFKILGAKNRVDGVRKAEHLNIIEKNSA